MRKLSRRNINQNYLRSFISWLVSQKRFISKIWITLFAISIAAFDVFYEPLSIIAVTSLFVAISPWAISHFKKVKFGSLEAEINTFENVVNDTEELVRTKFKRKKMPLNRNNRSIKDLGLNQIASIA